MVEQTPNSQFFSANKDFTNRPVRISLNELLRLPRNSQQVLISIDSEAYQEYLEANRALEETRENFGYVTNEAQQRLQNAVEQLNTYARIQLTNSLRG